MAASKIAVTIDSDTLTKLDRLVSEHKYPSRSRAIQDALEERLRHIEEDRLAQELQKLDPNEEREMAEEGLSADSEQWPEF
jgi:metal-responsive CopG/Arc/MetJ family transcriptional regulator